MRALERSVTGRSTLVPQPPTTSSEKEDSMTQVLTSTAREESVAGTGGINIFVRSWRPNGVARAIVVICHGFNAHSGQYQSIDKVTKPSGSQLFYETARSVDKTMKLYEGH